MPEHRPRFAARHALLPLLLLGLLTGCEQATQLTQQAASSVVGIVGEEVKRQTDGVIEQVASDANEVLQPLGVDTNQLASAVKHKTGQLVQQVLSPQADWSTLLQFKGKFPQDIGLFTAVSPIMPGLEQILGDQLPAWLAAMSAPSPLHYDKVLYLIGNKPTAGKPDTAWLIIDPENRKLQAGLIQQGQVKTFSSAGEALHQPAEVQQHIQQYSKK